ncbi:hypothetical protein B488_06630 [Liberibacter crescens BT-1]|uniref:Uncharacterized protein n=1 Tax=Liberibacter crescens (strain BT-1) TaxID=1215343 RepID=L0EUY8_LIBCB|nr:hypothetical protein [Liberibacter crescens]AGA64655.1 hypothetical protein B488_06630 [Liberibacter crescens BT-1]
MKSEGDSAEWLKVQNRLLQFKEMISVYGERKAFSLIIEQGRG